MSCIVLTNNIVPPPNVINRATQEKVPILLVPSDTYATARQVQELEPLLTKGDDEKVEILGKLVAQNVDLKALQAL